MARETITLVYSPAPISEIVLETRILYSSSWRCVLTGRVFLAGKVVVNALLRDMQTSLNRLLVMSLDNDLFGS